jgi:hypothetical protein
MAESLSSLSGGVPGNQIIPITTERELEAFNKRGQRTQNKFLLQLERELEAFNKRRQRTQIIPITDHYQNIKI